MARRHRKPTGGGGSDERPPEKAVHENGYYRIVEEEEGEFDYRPKDPYVDAPVGQFELAEGVRQLCGWCVDNIVDEDEYRQWRERLRKILFAGAVQEPIDPQAMRLLREIGSEITKRAEQIIGARAKRAALIFLCLGVVAGLGAAGLALVPGTTGTALRNYALLIASAAAAGAVAARSRGELASIKDFYAEAKRYDEPLLGAIESLILVLGVTLLVQNRWITLAIAGEPLDVTKSATVALALGFLLGLFNQNLMKIVSPLFERILRGATRVKRSAGRLRSRQAGGSS
jgi:hypothetical protein